MFESIPGQAYAKQYFARAFARGLSHAYLLAGDEGLGKAEFARELGVAIVTSCGGCGICDECERARRGASPDLTIVEREGEQLRLEQVERLVAELALRPFAAERRVWVLLEADKMTTEAANKLLKSLEEPPGYVFFVLVSDRVERLLPTIVSRCQTVEFQPVSDAEIAAFLSERHGLDADAAAALSRLARGSVERAARLAEDARGAGRRARYLELAARAVDGDADCERAFLDEVAKEEQDVADQVAVDLAASLAQLERTVADPRERSWHQKRLEEASKRDKARRTRLVALDALDHLASWLRDVWVVSQAGSQVVWNSDRIVALESAATADPRRYGQQLEVVAATRKDLYLNVDRRLALTAMFRRFEEVTESA